MTNNVHYEIYHSRKLASVTYNGMENNRATQLDTVEGLSQSLQRTKTASELPSVFLVGVNSFNNPFDIAQKM